MNYIIFLITTLVIISLISKITKRGFIVRVSMGLIALLIIFGIKDLNNDSFYSKAKNIVNNEILNDDIKNKIEDLIKNEEDIKAFNTCVTTKGTKLIKTMFEKVKLEIKKDVVLDNSRNDIEPNITDIHKEDVKAFNTYVISKLSSNGAKFIKTSIEKFKIEMQKDYINYINSKDSVKAIMIDVHEDDVEIFERNRFKLNYL